MSVVYCHKQYFCTCFSVQLGRFSAFQNTAVLGLLLLLWMIKTITVLLLFLAVGRSIDLCSACTQATVSLQNLLIAAAPQTPAKEVVQAVCERKYESQQLCKRVSEQLTPLAVQVGVRAMLKTGRICESFCPAGFYTRLDLQAEVQAILSGKDEAFSYLQELAVPQSSLKVDQGQTKLLHMTDIHLDLNYTAKASIQCDFPICCHAEHGFPSAPSSQAPEFGSPKCDAPLKLFDSAISYIQENVPKVDAAVLTGDYSAHNEWEKSSETVVRLREMVEGRFAEALNVPIISAWGNNEYLPDHQVDPTAYPEDAVKVVEIENGEGRKVSFVSVNTLFCDSINLYLIQDQTMPLRQIKTLNALLAQKAEVFLIAHIDPTSASCSEVYGTLFRAVLARHAGKIRGQFYGHTHMDQFVVNTDPRDNQTATSFGLLSGSLSPLNTGLPRFRVYELTNSFQIVNYDDYAFSLKTNSWNKNYNFKEYYGLPLDQPLTAKLMQDLQKRLLNELPLQDKYNQKVRLDVEGKRQICETFDTSEREEACLGAAAGFRGKVEDLLKAVQGPWGSYGSGIQ